MSVMNWVISGRLRSELNPTEPHSMKPLTLILKRGMLKGKLLSWEAFSKQLKQLVENR